jgi:hypothetical protein
MTKSAENRQGSYRRREPGVRGTLGLSTPTCKGWKETLVEREQQYVGIDLHRRRSVIVRMNDTGEVLGVSKVDNDSLALAVAVAEAGPNPEVALEACYGWYWAVDLLQAEGARVRLVHPSGLNWSNRRVKNDVKDATELTRRLRLHDVPEAWMAPRGPRAERTCLYRKLVALRTSTKAQVHAVVAKLGILPPVSDMFPRDTTALNLVRFIVSRSPRVRRQAGSQRPGVVDYCLPRVGGPATLTRSRRRPSPLRPWYQIPL